jgi:hypothetical protein
VNEKVSTGEGQLRMQFELSRNDDPSLYDDLIRFKKGTKRINRLRFLAHEGMVAQTAVQGSMGARGGTSLAPATVPSGHGLDGPGPDVTVTASMFDGGVADE